MSNHRSGDDLRRCVSPPRNGGPVRVVCCTPGPKKGSPRVGGRKKRSEMFLGSRAGQHDESAKLAGRIRGDEALKPLPVEPVTRTQPDCAKYLARTPVEKSVTALSFAGWEPEEIAAMVPKLLRMAEWSPGAFVPGRVLFPVDRAGRLAFFRRAGFREVDAVALVGGAWVGDSAAGADSGRQPKATTPLHGEEVAA